MHYTRSQKVVFLWLGITLLRPFIRGGRNWLEWSYDRQGHYKLEDYFTWENRQFLLGATRRAQRGWKQKRKYLWVHVYCLLNKEMFSQPLLCLLKVNFMVLGPSLHHSSPPGDNNFSQKRKYWESSGSVRMTKQSVERQTQKHSSLFLQVQFSPFLSNTILKVDHRHFTF